MNETLYEDISNISQVACVTPILQVVQGQDQTVTSPSGREFTLIVADYVIEGVPLVSSIVENYPILPSNITSGRNLQTGDSGVVLLSESTAEFFNVDVGDMVTILDQPFEVIGVFGSLGVEDVKTLYINLSDAQSLTENDGLVTSLAVFTDSSESVTEVAETIYALHPELNIVTSQDRLEQLELLQGTYENQLTTAETSLAQTEAMAIQEITLAISGTSLIVLFVMLYTVRERTKEIGTLKAIGFSNRNILSQFMLEGILLSFIAGLVGIGIGVFATPVLSGLLIPAVNAGTAGAFARATTVSSVSVSLTAELVLMALGGALFLGIVGSLYPAWKASRTSPMEALKYE
jgi:putative ABC transport system permease protein